MSSNRRVGLGERPLGAALFDRVSAPAMFPDNADLGALLRAAETVVRESSSLDVALRRLCLVLEGAFSLSRACVEVVDDAGERVAVAGVWSPAETAIRRGVTLPVDTAMYAEVRRAGRSIAIDLTHLGDPAPLLYQILRDEGHQSCAIVPLRFGSDLLGALGLSSGDHGAFTDEHVPSLDELGTVVGWNVLHLAFRRTG
jgi:GAF domain-containing protein